ncbi:MAG: VOC family protein [Flavobacterium sp.]|uniref:VOC family protein n=1 Tax=Flavobacterium sp. TaxID=239 RepID=UPI00120DBE72|nr:VOC family protein [Flavobacterium sp.]RZJ64429.1 MAG: VOC family protein [Flavobacterium sp.]
MKAVNPYLNFQGQSEQAFNFYKSVFGGEYSAFVRYGDMPQTPDQEGCAGMILPDKDKIMHISLPLPTGNTLMATDVVGSEEFPFLPGNNFSISVSADNTDEGKKLYDALSKDGNPMMPFAPADWGGHWGMLVDAFGIQWMVDCE